MTPLVNYDGPLDLLLEEVRRQKVPVEQIAMAPLVARYLEYVRTAPDRGWSLDVEWLHLAATLIYWKSRALLAPDPIREDPIRDDLIRQLITYRKAAGEELGRRGCLEDSHLSRVALVEPHVPSEAAIVTVWDLIQQARELESWSSRHRQTRHEYREPFASEQDAVTVAEMAGYLRNQLAAQGGDLDGVSLLENQPTTSHRASLFLAMLAMANDGQIHLQQNHSFGEFRVLAF